MPKSLSSITERRSLSRSLPAYVQIGTAALGTLVLLWGLYGLIFVFGTMPQSESGFAEGLALIIFGLSTLAGFVILSAGLLIPQGDASGIQFTPRQRKLLGYGVIAPIVSVVLVPVWIQLGSPLPEPVEMVGVAVLLVLLVSGPIATLFAIGSKLRSWRE